MKFAHIRVSEYFTFAEQIFHSEAISLARRANFTEKSTHCLGRQMCAFFWRRVWDSNPRDIAVKRCSRPPRYDRFDNPPCNTIKLWIHRGAQLLDTRSRITRLLYHNICGLSRCRAKFSAKLAKNALKLYFWALFLLKTVNFKVFLKILLIFDLIYVIIAYACCQVCAF